MQIPDLPRLQGHVEAFQKVARPVVFTSRPSQDFERCFLSAFLGSLAAFIPVEMRCPMCTWAPNQGLCSAADGPVGVVL